MHLQEYIDTSDYVLSAIAEKMVMRYNKYWGDLNNNETINLMMFVVVVIDPRTELGSLEYWFKDVLGAKKCNDRMKN